MDFSKTAPLSEMQRLRSYSRRNPDGTRETWDETVDRVLYSPHLGLQVLGKFTPEEMALIDEELRNRRGFGSARWLWVGGTEWIERPDSYSGAFNCTSFLVVDWNSFGYLMDLGMQGCGTGAVLELDCIDQLPSIKTRLDVEIIGSFSMFGGQENTEIEFNDDGTEILITVGDSRKGWVSAYEWMLNLASSEYKANPLKVRVDISNVRRKGSKLKGFGGIANPVKLPEMFVNVAKTLNKANGRKLNSLEICILIGEAASCYVAGNIRRAAGMKQGSASDDIFTTSKDNLWQVDDQGNWRIDPERDSLRSANHTRVYHYKPTLEECIESVTKQFYSGEGAIQYAPEAITRANADLLDTHEKKQEFLLAYASSPEDAGKYLSRLAIGVIPAEELEHRLHRYGLNPLTLAA